VTWRFSEDKKTQNAKGWKERDLAAIKEQEMIGSSFLVN